MANNNLYSKRNKIHSDIIYDQISEKCKNQIIHIWTKFFNQLAPTGQYSPDYKAKFWKGINLTLCQEHGKKTLATDPMGFKMYSDQGEVEKYFDKNKNINECIDIIENTFNYILQTPSILKSNFETLFRGSYSPEEAVADLNDRLNENDIGYQFVDGMIVRVDNNLLHKEVVIPVIDLLSSTLYQNVNEEFLSAHKHYRNKQNKECLNDCLKALESTMKIICEKNKWEYDSSKDTSTKLIDICLKKELIPKYLQSHFTALRTTLEAGIPTLRNKLGGHGQGVNKIVVPDHFASYMLYLTGTTIKFLVDCQLNFLLNEK